MSATRRRVHPDYSRSPSRKNGTNVIVAVWAGDEHLRRLATSQVESKLRSVPKLDRSLVALALTIQIIFGVVFGIMTQIFLLWAVVFKAMPAVGLCLLDVARAIANYNLPLRIVYFFAAM